MRRLAKQTRDDVYASRRDYQIVHPAQGQRIGRRHDGGARLHLHADITERANTSLVGFGGYFRSSKAVDLVVSVTTDAQTEARTFRLGRSWSRIGVALDHPGARSVNAVLEWPAGADLDFWGISSGALELPDAIAEATADELNQAHLAPETFYLPHEGVLDMTIVTDDSTVTEISAGAAINLKKCSYCGRLLPLDPRRLGALAFHKHLAKRTLHQNECRACKKWRINDDFNPKRTVDQLHESSVITRERQLFLRDPERLQTIKDRTGAGLKSQVWERFDRRCFNCGKDLELDEVHLDHTRPLAYLWPIDEHASCLCAECNNHKQDRFPTDFYTEEQLKELSKICGLPLAELQRRDINEVEMQRILDDLPTFAKEWDPRTFAATARKIKEMRPDIDLLERLHEIDARLAKDLTVRIRERPPAVGE